MAVRLLTLVLFVLKLSGVAVSAGKSTLLQVLAGRKLITASHADVLVKGRDVFRDTPDGITYLGTEWLVPAVSGN